MSAQLFLRYWIPSFILLCLSFGPAASDPPDVQTDIDPISRPAAPRRCGSLVSVELRDTVADNNSDRKTDTPKEDLSSCDDSNPASTDSCVSDDCVNEPVVTCPCADDYADAVTAFNAQPGGRLTTWDVCDAKFHKVGINARSEKVAQMPGGSVKTLIWLASARSYWPWSYPGMCSAITLNDKLIYGEEGWQGVRLTVAEVAACEALTRGIAVCPE